MKKVAVIILLITIYQFVLGQKEVSNWYFGHAGLNFNCLPPSPISQNPLMEPKESCSSISDNQGNLLFYTDGMTVYDKTHHIMLNGSNIGQDTGCGGSSTQGALIVKKPLQDSLYYIFTTDCAEHQLLNGLRYSIVNMNLNNGKGKVVIKNQFLLSKVCEKLSATRHENGNDVWIVTHEFASNRFFAYKLTDIGLDTIPIISCAGRIQSTFDNYSACASRGYLKFSPQGDKLAVISFSDCHPFVSYPELFSFNNATGIVTFKYNVNTADSMSYYGASFSPNGNLLYVSSGWSEYGSDGYIHQFDLTSNDSDIIANSKYVVCNNPDYPLTYALQIGPDGKIYNASAHYLNVIDAPNIYGPGCNFQLKAIYLGSFCGTYLSGYGLPNNDESIYLNTFTGNECDASVTNVNYSYTITCIDYPVFFNDNSFFSPDTANAWLWDFGDPLSTIGDSTANSSQIQNPQHIFSSIGAYNVKLIAYLVVDGIICKSDTIIKEIRISSCGTGVDNMDKENQIIIYPNPASNYLNISTTDLITKVEIYDMQKQLVSYKYDKNGIQKIDFEIENGVYILSLTSNNRRIFKKVSIINNCYNTR